jgi:predicted ATP-grasp superfamily ATP-dependent carboligase
VTETKFPAVLLGGGETALPVARSLGRAGVPVFALGTRSDPVRFSRYVEFVDLGSSEQSRWLEWLLGAAPPGSVVLPCADEGLELVARNRGALNERGLVPIEANDEMLLAVLDKERTYEIAASHGITVPRTTTVHDHDELRTAVDQLGFPCALKPLQAHAFRRHFAAKGFVATEWKDLLEYYRMSEAAGVQMLLTEMVPGPDAYHSSYTYLDEHGKPLFTFTKQKLRQYPITFGAGVYHVMDWNEEVSDLGLHFCQSLGLRGLLNVEFKRDVRNGRLVLIECNHRFTASTALHLAAGLDVPLFTYNRLVGAPLPRLGPRYREGITLWYPLDDFRSFKAYRRAGQMTLFAYLRTIVRPHHFATASLWDPVPLFAALVHRARSALRKARRRLGWGTAQEADAPAPVGGVGPGKPRETAETR